jgi:dephospho-CoA kinase
MNIVGISGLPRGGKDTLAELLIEHGYYGVSLGDIVRDESRSRHANEPDPISVKNMTETSNYLRSKKGADFALKEALARFDEASKTKAYKGLVVFSVRAPVEADYIVENGGQLIWVDATDQVRYERSKLARRAGEAEQSIEEMLDHERLQEVPQPGLPEGVQMNTRYVKSKATKIFENNGNSIEAFKDEAEKALGLS